MAGNQFGRVWGALLVMAALHCGGVSESDGPGTSGGSSAATTGTTSSGSTGTPTSTGMSTSTGATTSTGAGGGGTGGPDASITTGSGSGGMGGAGSGTAGAGGATGGGRGGSGTGGAGTGGGPSFDGGIDPSMITAAAYGANQTIGLEWPRVLGATAYKLYWSNASGVTPQNGMAVTLDANPTYVHRGLTNGMDYYYVVSALTAAGEGPPSPQVTAKPGGEWALEQLGAGDFDDIATGNRVPRVPIAKRAHILLLAEGYLASELAIFHDHAKHNLQTPTNDVDRWIKEIFSLEPYSKLQEGFVVWFLPRASMTHTDGGNSAFGTEPNTAQGPLMASLMAGQFLFPPTSTSRNFVASFLLFDPARMRAGVSGHTSSCSSGGISMRCAFGIGHAHEFTHAFANVRDEYIENDNSSSSTGETSNVVATNKCGEVPWRHLLEGAGINTTPQLVGAFGRPMQGYHSELQCHMNGTHDNGEAFCGPGQTLTLRPSRFCNFCRELIAYRLLYRTEVLAGTESAAFQTWKATYRTPFFKRFGFTVPTPVPQTITCTAGTKPVYEACVP